MTKNEDDEQHGT